MGWVSGDLRAARDRGGGREEVSCWVERLQHSFVKYGYQSPRKRKATASRLQPSFVSPTTKLTSGGEVNPAELTTRMKVQWKRARVFESTSHKGGLPGEPERALKVPLLVKPTK